MKVKGLILIRLQDDVSSYYLFKGQISFIDIYSARHGWRWLYEKRLGHFEVGWEWGQRGWFGAWARRQACMKKIPIPG